MTDVKTGGVVKAVRADIPADDQKVVIQNAIWTHVLPYVAWLLMLQILTPPSGLYYALRVAAGLGLFLWFCPWRWYDRLRVRNLPLAFAVGVFVFVMWIFPETDTAARLPWFYRAYQYVGMLPPWKAGLVQEGTPYAPWICGWPLTLVRLLGSAMVISAIEEFFWRGFIYRWLIRSNFLRLDIGFFQASSFFFTALLFGSVHHRWFVGFLTGIIYGWLVLRTRDIWAAVIAHGITNFLLGLYVLSTGNYIFW